MSRQTILSVAAHLRQYRLALAALAFVSIAGLGLLAPQSANALICGSGGLPPGVCITSGSFERLTLAAQMNAWTEISSITGTDCIITIAASGRNGPFNFYAQNAPGTYAMGLHYDTQDGKRACSNITAQEIITAAGYSSAQALIDAFGKTNSLNPIDRQALYNFVLGKTGAFRSPLVEYSILMKAFMAGNGCAASIKATGTGPYFIIGPTGDVQQVDFAFDSGKNVPVGPGMNAGSDNVFQCTTIANKFKNRLLAQSAADYAKQLAAVTGTNINQQISDATASTRDAGPPTCDDFGDGIGWIACWVVGAMDKMVTGLEEAINDLLSVDRLYGNTSGPIYQLWATVRNISLLVLIPMMMLMVIGTAIDMGPFDPYTVKKALPRMVYAAIFILLSWSICTFFIDMSDVIGAGIVNFLTNVGADGNARLVDIIQPVGGAGIFTGVIIGTTVGFATGALSFGIIGSLALVATLTFLMGYLALLFRQMLILGLLIFAPAAILVWIFPGNDKLWTVWKTSFIGLLAVYPVVGAMIGMGRVAAYIVSQL